LATAAQCLFSLLCIAVAAYAFRYLSLAYAPGNPFAAQFAISGWDVPAHFFGAGLALLLVPVQISRTIRRRWPALHRLSGWLYAIAVLIGGISALSLAPKAQAGLPTMISFLLLGVFWLGTTAFGIACAATGRLQAHRTWMAYSIALTAAAISLRVILGVGLGVLRAPFEPTYITAAWGCWVVNLLLCALILQFQRGSADRRWVFLPRWS